MPDVPEEVAAVPDESSGQTEGTTVEKPGDAETQDDVRALGLVRRWLPSLITGSGLLIAIVSSGVLFTTRLGMVETQLSEIRTAGTPRDQGFALRIASLETAFVQDRAEREKDHELLLKIDRKLSLLICKNDRTKCTE